MTSANASKKHTQKKQAEVALNAFYMETKMLWENNKRYFPYSVNISQYFWHCFMDSVYDLIEVNTDGCP